MTWRHLEKGLRTHRSSQWILCVCVTLVQLLGMDASTDMLLRGHILLRLQGVKETLKQKKSLTPFSYCIHKKQQMQEA